MHVSYLPRAVAAGRAAPRRGRGRTGSWSRTGARSGSAAWPASRRQAPPLHGPRPAGEIVAGGAFGTPELLLRSGLGGRQVGRNLHIHPACWVGARYEEEVRGWEGVMQSYYVDEWEPTADPARGDLHAARLRRRLAARRRPRAPGGDARLRPRSARSASTSPTSPSGRVGLGARRLAAGQLQADRATTPPPRLRHRPRRRNPLRRRRHRGLPEHRPGRRCCDPGDLAEFEATSFKPSELRLEAFHPMGTARIAADPREGACAADGSVNGTRRPLRRRRLPLPDLGRRQPDDDHHRLRQAGGARAGREVRRSPR